ncbi:type III secretion system HrpP C-terminal domain-containing protein [Pseudomonas sp. FP1762]|uniref:type III secretion system HrpP C-terminal domain-containing protein n=2 Tax=Pseudomonas TaxID=286 RepID=UPI002735DF10|nr:type III secretion system HrpP C-terminal domain-containing protein [Pseudomonas sp. FP1762]WLG62472.1 type III secretion system HrpP C-terminal domain-containing protein [Pseudomonas sp. FP1762]
MNLSSPAHAILEHRAPAKPERQEPQHDTSRDRPQPQGGTARPQGRGPNELDRPRETSARDSGKTRHGDSERMADGLFFQQLLAPLGGMGGQGQGGSRGQSSAGQADGMGTAGFTAWNQLVDDLTMRLPAGTGQSLQATLFMPNLGRIGLNARNRSPRGWDIDLDCAETHAAEHLRQNHPRCQDDLSRALCQPVNLSVRHRGCA